ncbi:hypothetical protein RHSIM_Rhsim06G0122100 [Rhododendron simsii]|uniref:Ubiquinone biosynthesis O-methyltransferase, mitochondrial n=1 Tax=Rhododendron simsii TaxID=118357 RepID=A0A834LIY1_RHOSS|nr:hypothetical protein RHSIM_Rhsim06G0122100 [Rhododendron simsii]
MASKLLRNTSNRIFSLVRTNPNPNFPLEQLNPTTCQALLSRPYSDVAQPVPIEPSLPEKPPVGGGTTNGKKTFGKGTMSSSSLKAAELAKFAAIAETWSVNQFRRICHFHEIAIMNLDSDVVPLENSNMIPLSFIIRWDAEGPFKPLHVMNPTRLSFIRSTLCQHFRFMQYYPVFFAGSLYIFATGEYNSCTHLRVLVTFLCFRKDPLCPKPLEGLKVVDVGCGGGILSEPLARMGATVMGIDAVEKNITIARLHADSDPLTSTIEYRCTTAGTWFCELVVQICSGVDTIIRLGMGAYRGGILEEKEVVNWKLKLKAQTILWTEKLVEERRDFDAVIALEVIEHVADPAEFCKSLAALTVSDGATVISTINRSMRSYATAIIAAEYILQWLPKGTHQWSSFLTPEELTLILQRASITVQEMAGFVYNPLTGRWSLSDDISVNFIAFGTKTHQ